MPSEKVYVFSAEDDGSHTVVGLLSRDAGKTPVAGSFGYAASWLENRSGTAYPLDPERMPLLRAIYATQKRGGLPGPIADALPDRWGRRVIEAQDRGVTLSDVDVLLMTGAEGIGRLRFSATSSPPKDFGASSDVLALDEIAEAFLKLENDEPVAPAIAALYKGGQSLGGARPKTAVRHDGASWIAKFERKGDDIDHCSVEHATMRLAGVCGLDVAETRVHDTGSRKVLLVRRFDRDRLQPCAHYVSALSALDLDETSAGGGYPDLADWLRRHSEEPAKDMRELFRRMVFNMLCGNRDDHLKNHALLHSRAGWRLSPAYDIVPQLDGEALQAISVGRFGPMSTIANALSKAQDFRLGAEEARACIDELIAAMTPWRQRFREWGVADNEIRRLERCFALVDRRS